MATDLRYQLLDEIALEGLDGITLNTFWFRLKERPDFKPTLDDGCKNYIWNCILSLTDVEYFELKEERPDLVPYNRFHYLDPETNHFLETEHVPDDIYPVCMINDNGIRGSCESYKTRRNVTDFIRRSEKIPLKEAIERYSNRLVLVASQSIRWRTILGDKTDPDISLQDLEYCILERIGRARYHGETSVGKLSLQAFKESTKTIFYTFKKISSLGVIKRQGITAVKKPANTTTHCMLYHLERFYFQLKQRWQFELCRIADYLDSRPNKMEMSSTCKTHLKMKEQHFKKVIQRTDNSGERYFEYVEVPYRQIHPDAAAKEYMAKSLRVERSLRHVKMIKDPRLEEEAGSEDEDFQQEKDVQYKFEPVYDKPQLAQLYDLIRQSRQDGISQTDIERCTGLNGLQTRRYLKMLIFHGSVQTVLQDIGRQKTTMYVCKDVIQENVLLQTETAEKEKFDRITAEKESQVAKNKAQPLDVSLNDAPPTDARTVEIRKELEKVDQNNTYFKKPLTSEQEKTLELKMHGGFGDTYENVTIEESPLDIKVKSKRPNEKFGMERFGSLLTQTHIRRANWIIETVRAIKILEQFQMRKLIRHREEEMNLQFMMDQKSLKRLLNALIEDQKVRSIKVTIQMGKKEKVFNYITDVDVTPASDVMRRVVEEAKLKHFSFTKEELKGQKKLASPPKSAPAHAPKVYSEAVPESAQESVQKYQEYRKKLLQKTPPLKYSKMGGLEYGLLPKFLRTRKLHQILWYLSHEIYGKQMEPIEKTADGGNGEDSGFLHSSEFEKIDMSETKQLPFETTKEPPVYVDECSWKRYLPPVPCHKGYPRGWCFIGDILLLLPVSTFCQIINICYDIEGLSDILNHPFLKYYPVRYLPFKISQQLLFARKYIHSFHENCVVLCEMGLLSFGPDIMKEKEQTFIYLHENASLLDTRDSLWGYNKTKLPSSGSFIRKTYKLSTEEGCHSYWEDMQIIALGSNLGFKSAIKNDVLDEESFEEYSLTEALKRKSPATVQDVGRIPGDLRGAAGMDSSLFSHTLRNWALQRSKVRPMDTNKYTCDKRYDDKERPAPDKGHFTKKPEGPEKSAKEKLKRKLTTNVKGNRGGKGVKRKKEPLKKEPASVRGSTERLRNKQRIHRPYVRSKKASLKKGDEKDKTILRQITKQRVTWSSQEDTILLICNLANLLMEKQRQFLIVSYSVARDILHEKCPEAHEKTSMACARRLKFALKNPQTQQNSSLFYQEALQDKYIVKEFSSQQWVSTDEHFVVPKFRTLVDYLLTKFQSLNVGKFELPERLSDLHDVTVEQISKLHEKKKFSDVTSKTDICADVLRNILHSAILLQDKQGRVHEMFKLLTQYPDSLLVQVIRELRIDGLFVLNKKITAKLKRANTPTAGLGLRHFKVSQRYMYNYKQRYLSAVFEESANFLKKLSSTCMSDQVVELDFNPKGCQSLALMPLIFQKKIDIKVTMPDEFVIVDLEGFYHFPWGRGKFGSRSEKYKPSAESLKELFPGTDFSSLQLPKESTPATGFSISEKEMKADGADVEPNGSEAESKEKERSDVSQETEGVIKESRRITEEKEDGLETISTAEETVQTETVASTGLSLTSSTTVTAEKKGCETEGAENKDEDDKDKTVEGSQKSSDTEYNVYKHGSSELHVPQHEVVYRSKISDHLRTVASRTLLSIRRADEEGLDDIRIFNAQDNFVVKSCAISVKVRDPEEEKENFGNSTVTEKTVSDNAPDKNSTVVTDIEASRLEVTSVGLGLDSEEDIAAGTLMEDTENTIRETEKSESEVSFKSDERRKMLLDTLLLKKEKMKDIWNSLQLTLPFQLDLQKVWEHLKVIGIPETEIAMCQQVYGIVEQAREIGIRQFDLKKQFPKEFPWRKMVQILIEQQADAEKLVSQREIDRK